MSENGLTYEASVYKRTVNYRNFKGEVKETELFFALDPIQLMQFIASFQPKKQSRSGNPAKKDEVSPITDEQQLKFVRDLAAKAAGFPSVDGESWEPYAEFTDSIAGKAFMTKLASSDADRKEFAQKVVLDPFQAFVNFAVADTSNDPKEMAQFKAMAAQLENIFQEKPTPDETLEDRRARLAAELASLGDEPSES